MKRLTISLIVTLLFVSGSLYAKQDKDKKDKHIPYGLQKKVNNGGTLPPGWQKKIQKGEVVDNDILKNSKVVYSDKYPKIENTKIYRLENKIFRVLNDTKEILEILKQ